MKLVDYTDYILIALISIHLYVSPYTKVEESFNIQAIHDMLTYGWNLSSYDHVEFPGVVPRTFIGALVVSVVTYPFSWVASTGLELQMLARGVIGLMNGAALIRLRRTLTKQYGSLGLWYAAFQYSQFHIIYYASRTLPNFMVLPLTNLALDFCLKDQFHVALAILAVCGVVFRLELVAFCGCLALVALASRKVQFMTVVRSGVFGGFVGLNLTLLVDSVFWNNWAVPEFDSLIFNVVQGKSADWGVEPVHAYFTKYMLMIFFPPTVLLCFPRGLFNLQKLDNISLVGCASILYVCVMSLQPHKEWRFIVYAIPGITIAGARGAAKFYAQLPSQLGEILLLSPVVSLVVSAFFLAISSLNYPGGVALAKFNALQTTGSVHMDVYSCMSGITRFGQDNPRVVYDKTEDREISYGDYDYVISSSKLEFPVIDTVKAFAGIQRPSRDEINAVLDGLRTGKLDSAIALLQNIITQKDAVYIYKTLRISETEQT